ncbi:MAG: RNA 2',3'-cyclic phosphodiesterase [Acidobacteriota bacterium]
MRTFIAIDFPEEIKKLIYEKIDVLKKFEANIKWIREEGIHLTLKFLGEIDENKLNLINNKLKKISESIPSFSLIVQGMGTFPERSKSPRVIWIGIKEETNLKRLQENIEEEMEKLSFQRETRKFSPHITIGRVKDSKHITKILDVIEKERETLFGKIKVKEIILFRSILKPDGAQYIPLEKSPLQNA